MHISNELYFIIALAVSICILVIFFCLQKQQKLLTEITLLKKQLNSLQNKDKLAQLYERQPSGSSGEGLKIILKDAGENKIEVIKVLRSITKTGLKETKDLIDSVPNVVHTCSSSQEAEDIISALELAGAQVEIESAS